MNFFKKLKRAITLELREHKSSFIVYTVLRILVIAIVVFAFIFKSYESAFLGILTLALLIMPSFLQVALKIEIPTLLEIIILLFIFSAEILGEIGNFYMRFPYWDTLLHTLNGFLAAAVGFSLVNLLNKSERFLFELSPIFTCLVAFCFSMTIGVLWEMFEYSMDTFFLFDMQKDTIINQISSVTFDPALSNKVYTISGIESVDINGKIINGYLDIGLIDTMNDLIVNFIGAVVFSVFGFFYTETKGKGEIVKNLMPTVKKKENDYLKN